MTTEIITEVLGNARHSTNPEIAALAAVALDFAARVEHLEMLLNINKPEPEAFNPNEGQLNPGS